MAVLEVTIKLYETFARDEDRNRYATLTQGRDGLMSFTVFNNDSDGTGTEFLIDPSDVMKAWRLLKENTD